MSIKTLSTTEDVVTNGMDRATAVTIDYWAIQEDIRRLTQLVGIDEFSKDMSENYISRVHGRPADLGGGLYELAIQFITNISVHDVVKLIADGVAFDLLKSGTKSFVLRPFLAAYEKLKAKNTEHNVDINEIRFMFSDAEIVVTKICRSSIFESLGDIFDVLTRDFENLRNGDGEYPYTIQIPVFEDPEKRLCRFRVLLDVDETISNVTKRGYLCYWGVEYDFERTRRVFDLKNKLLIDSDFYSIDRYWQEWESDRKRNNLK
jgi:hypothetical protein